MTAGTLRGRAAVVGIGQTSFFQRAASPDPAFKLALQSILAACDDASLDPRDIDGLVSFHTERSDPARLAAALGMLELRYTSLPWGGGGGGASAAVGHAAAAIAAGLAECVVVFRSLGPNEDPGDVAATPAVDVSGDSAYNMPYGLISPAQRFALPAMRFMEEHGIERNALRAIALAAHRHAQFNPRALMHGRPLTAAAYDASRWLAEPHRLNDCCMESEGAAAMILMSAAAAAELPRPPVYLLGVAQGAAGRAGTRLHNSPTYASAGFTTLAPRLYEMAGVGPGDMDVVQCYDNFTTGTLMALIEYGLVRAEEANAFLTLANLSAPHGKLPLNTSGGHLAECYLQGLGLHLEAVRQLRGESTAPVPGAALGLVISGPMVSPTSSLIFGTAEALG